MRVTRRALGATGLAALAAPAMAQEPTIRVLVPYAAGGPTDVLARAVTERLGVELGARLAVENRTGAGTVVATEAVAKARPDGATLLLTSVALAVNASLVRNLPYDTLRDLAPVALLARVPLVLLVPPNHPARTLPEFLDWVRARPGAVSYGSAGNGSAPHLATALLLLLETGLQAQHVPYRGSAPALVDLTAGRIDLYVDAVSTGMAQVRGGSARALATTMLHRLPTTPDLPTVAEGGVPGYECYTWNGLFAPTGTPEPAIVRLNAATYRALAAPEVRRRLLELGAEIAEPAPPEALGTTLRDEVAKWRRVVQASGMVSE